MRPDLGTLHRTGSTRTKEPKAVNKEHSQLHCPSAQPDMPGSLVLGVVLGTPDEPRMTPLERLQPVTPELLQMAAPVRPTQVFRFAAPCAGTKCHHFDGTKCQLATRIVQLLPEATTALPTCHLRPDCRWWKQEGKSACMRCPQVITECETASKTYIDAALGSHA